MIERVLGAAILYAGADDPTTPGRGGRIARPSGARRTVRVARVRPAAPAVAVIRILQDRPHRRRQRWPIPDGGQQAGRLVLDDLGQVGCTPANDRLRGRHGRERFVDAPGRVGHKRRRGVGDGASAMGRTGGEPDSIVVECQRTAKSFQCPRVASRPEDDEIQVLRLVAQHVEGDDGVLGADASLGRPPATISRASGGRPSSPKSRAQSSSVAAGAADGAISVSCSADTPTAIALAIGAGGGDDTVGAGGSGAPRASREAAFGTRRCRDDQPRTLFSRASAAQVDRAIRVAVFPQA